jgi:hypothetical protein
MQMRHYRAKGWLMIYTDETYIHRILLKANEWSDDNRLKLLVLVSKGQRAL